MSKDDRKQQICACCEQPISPIDMLAHRSNHLGTHPSYCGRCFSFLDPTQVSVEIAWMSGVDPVVADGYINGLPFSFEHHLGTALFIISFLPLFQDNFAMALLRQYQRQQDSPYPVIPEEVGYFTYTFDQRRPGECTHDIARALIMQFAASLCISTAYRIYIQQKRKREIRAEQVYHEQKKEEEQHS